MPSSFDLRRRRALLLRQGSLVQKLRNIDFVLWGVPLLLVLLAGVLIASTQRQVDYADWYHHWITAGLGILIARGVAAVSIEKLRPFLLHLYGLTVASLFAVRLVGTSALGAQRW